MLRTKLYGLTIACTIGCVGLNPVDVSAAETNTATVTLSENNQGQNDKRAAFEEAIKKANEKWNTLSVKQKGEVYALLEDEMKAEMKLMNKLVELGVIEKDDASFIKARMQEKLDEIKKNGEFPLSRPKRERKQ